MLSMFIGEIYIDFMHKFRWTKTAWGGEGLFEAEVVYWSRGCGFLILLTAIVWGIKVILPKLNMTILWTCSKSKLRIPQVSLALTETNDTLGG